MSGPLPAFLAPLTVPASRVYGWAVERRNARFDRGVDVQAVDRPVISIGNLTTGGVGKTPMVAWLCDQLRKHNHQPVIAMRGYMARPGELSDEQAEYAMRLPDVPVVANPDRVAALRSFLPQNPAIDCVVLDDGFQHRYLKRDLDLVLIDATAGTMSDQLLPAGNLREPLTSLRRADGVIVTHATSVDRGLAREIERYHGSPPLAWTQHVWAGLRIFDPATARENAQTKQAASLSHRTEPIDWLRRKRVLTLLGVGKPASIMDQLEKLGAKVMVNIPARDHERYDRPKLTMARGLCDGCDAMVMTGKDWVKVQSLIDLTKWPVPIVVPELALKVFEGAHELRDLALAAVRAPLASASDR